MFRFTADCSWESSGTTLSSLCVYVCVCVRAHSVVLLQKPNTTLELRFIRPAGLEELTLQALSPEQRDYRVFTDKTVVGSTSC